MVVWAESTMQTKAEHKTCRIFKALEVGSKRQAMLGEF